MAGLSPWPTVAAEVAAAVAVLEAALPPGAPVQRLGPVGAAMVQEFAANAPESVKSESVIRVCAWLFQRSPGVRAQSVRLGGAVALESTFSAATGALSNSGAKSLLSPWRVHRAGAIR